MSARSLSISDAELAALEHKADEARFDWQEHRNAPNAAHAFREGNGRTQRAFIAID